MTCRRARADLSAHLDGELAEPTRLRLRRHLDACADCRAREEQLRAVGAALRALPAPSASPYLSLRLRVLASQFGARRKVLTYWRLRGESWLRAMLVPVSAGMLAAVCFFAFMFGSVGHSVVAATAVADVPLPLSSPAQLLNPAVLDVSQPLLVQADIDSLGRVDGYRVLSGPRSSAVITKLNNALLLSVFKPATILGEPTPGRVLISYDTVTVRVRG